MESRSELQVVSTIPLGRKSLFSYRKKQAAEAAVRGAYYGTAEKDVRKVNSGEFRG